jgi:hypothetical protein
MLIQFKFWHFLAENRAVLAIWRNFYFFVMVATLDTGRRWRTQFWKGTTQVSFQQSCSILSQKVPKFELYKHNDELFNIYYRIFYELWTFAYFERLSKLEKRGDEILKHGGHLGYRTALTYTNLKGDHTKIISAKFGWDWLCSFRGEDFF